MPCDEAHRRGGAAVREQRFDLGAAIRHVDRLQGRADVAGREIAEEELDAIRQLRRHDVAGAESEARENPPRATARAHAGPHR